MTRCRVLHLLNSGEVRGSSLARIFRWLSQGLGPKRYDLQGWFLLSDGPLVGALREAGIQVRVVKWTRAYDLPGALRFWNELRKEPFDIIHQRGSSLRNQIARSIIRRVSNARILLHPTGRVNEARSPKLIRLRTAGADVVVVSSRAVAECVGGPPPRIVPPGVPILEELPGLVPAAGSSSGTVLGSAARLVPIKGIVYLVRALALLRKEIPGIRLEIAGLGQEGPKLQNEVRSLGLEDSVAFIGWKDNLTPVMSGWDVFVLPSLDEGFGMAALEAMAGGLPVVASAVGGVPELVEDGRTGLLVPAGNPEALARALRRLLLSADLRRSMGEAGRARARAHFSEERMVLEFSRIYEELLALPRQHG